MALRKAKIVDAGLQLPLIMKTAAFFLLGALVPLLLFSWHLKDTGEKIARTADELSRAIQIEEDIVQAFAVLSKEGTGETGALLPAHTTIVKDHGKAVFSVKSHISRLRQLHGEKATFLYVISGWFLFMVFFLLVYLLRFSHRIAGPIHVMNKAVKELNEGRLPVMRPLRKGDQCQSLYSDFSLLVQNLEKSESEITLP